MGLERTGYRMTFSGDYLDRIIAKIQSQFPNMSNSSNNFAIVLSRVLSEILEENDSIRAEGYNNVYVATAVGRHLDKAVAIGGVERRFGTRSYGKIKVTKEADIPSISIAPNTLIESGDIKFYTINKGYVPINTNTPVEIEIASVETGIHQNITQRSTFVPVVAIRGLKQMICEDGTFGGTDTESDQELRRRYYLTIGSYSNSSLNGVISEVAKMNDIVRVSGRENNTDETVNGLPPHSFEIFCEGASNEDIAKKIFDVKPAGIQTYGSVKVTVPYNNNNYIISFSRFDKQAVYYKLTVKPGIGVSGSTVENDIKQALIDYTGASTKINHSELVGYLYNNVNGIASLSNIKFGHTSNPTGDTELVVEAGKTFFTDTDKIIIELVGGL